MAKNREESKPKKFLVKIYLLVLFIAGMILGFSYQSARDKKVVDFEQMLDNNVVTVLTSNGISQNNVISQYVKEIRIKGRVCHEYYKKIELSKSKKAENFEPSFKTVARNFKIELKKIKYKNGAYRYSFSDKIRTYSIIDFVK
jgi:hypothetical protein